MSATASTVEAFEVWWPRWERLPSYATCSAPDYLIWGHAADLAAYGRWLTTQLMGDAAMGRVGPEHVPLACPVSH